MTKLKAAIDSFHAYQQLIKDTNDKLKEVEAVFGENLQQHINSVAHTLVREDRQDLFRGWGVESANYKVDLDKGILIVIELRNVHRSSEHIDIRYDVKTDDLYVNAYDRRADHTSASLRVSHNAINIVHKLITNKLDELVKQK